MEESKMDFRTAYDKLDGIYYDESSMAGECWALVKARIRELEAEISEMRDRYATFEELAPPDVPRKKFVETCFSAWEKSCELEAEISERRLDYTEDCKRLDAAINDFEHQLAAAQERNVALQSEHLNHVNALHEQLTAMTVERDSESRRAKHYSDKVTELEQQLAAMQRIIDSYRRII
jgi:DNA repair exonuclease SbcCD ATPase subunit